jgi:hypothetical protein
MVAQAESIEVLLHVSLGRGIKRLSIPIDDPSYGDSVQLGEKICVAALKCFIVSLVRSPQEIANSSGVGILCSSRISGCT